MHRVDHARQLVGRRARLARRPHPVHLKEGETQPGHLQDLLVGRVGMLRVADPDEHPQVAPAGMRQPVGGDAQADAKRAAAVRLQHERLVARPQGDDLLHQFQADAIRQRLVHADRRRFRLCRPSGSARRRR